MGNPIRTALCLLFALVLPWTFASAQQAEVSYSDDFQSYGSPKNPPGWVDTSVGTPKPTADGLYKTWPDPLQGSKATNIAYGTKQSSGKPEGNNPRIGTFSTLSTKNFNANGRFEYRGRFLRTTTDTRIGFSFLSSYPETDKYYLIGLWSVPGSTATTMQLFGFGAGSITGTTNSNFTPGENVWYRFLIQVDDVAGATKIKARFWPDGQPEPTTFSIDAQDAASTRLTTGRIGVWSAVKGSAYWDDLYAKSPVDHTPPVITFFEGGVQLPPNTTTAIDHDARVDIRATDDLSGVASVTATADGQPYTPLTPIPVEGPHVIKARAVDYVGNASESQTTVLVDKTPPVITLTEGTNALPLPISRFNRVPAIDIKAVDQWTGATFAATLDGKPYTSGTPINVQGTHHLVVEAIDGVKNKSLVQATILVDLGAPVIEFYEKGVKLSSPAKFKFDPSIEVRLTDAHSTPTYAATLENGTAWKSLDPMPIGWHKITVNAIDEAGNTSTATLDVLVDKDAPVVVLSEGGTALDVAKTAKYNRDVAIDIAISDATSKIVASSSTLDGQPYTSGTSITVERNTHTITVHAEDEAGNTTDVTLAVLVDKSAPVIAFSESNVKLDARELQKFRRDATINIDVTDAVSTATYTATLTTPARSTSAPYTSGTPVTVEDTHEIKVSAIDEVGNTAEATLTILVDKTPPVIAFSESGTPLDTAQETPFGRDVRIDISVTDNLPGVEYTAKLDGADYTSGAPITADGPHVVTVAAVDKAGNPRDGEVKVLVDKTGPAIKFRESGVELDTTKRNDFNRLPSIEIVVTDVHSTVTYVAKLNEAAYTSGTPVAEGFHSITVRATDARGNATDAKLDLLVDTTPPVVKLKDKTTGNDLPATGAIFARDLPVEAVIQDLSQTTTAATLDGNAFSLTVPVAAEGQHTLSVTVTDELAWKTTVGSTFIIDKTPPKISVFEGTTPLLNGASFARDITINASAEDITPYTLTATIDGNAYTLGSLYTAEGSHTLVVNGVDAAGNRSEPVTIRFHIDKNAPEVTLLESGQPFPDGKTFTRDVIATVTIKAATETTTVATIDGEPYTLGQPYTKENENGTVPHHIKVVVTNLANLSTTVEAKFFIDKTPPTLTLYAKPSVPFTDGMKFAEDITPIVVADDNQAKPPKVVMMLDGAELPAGTLVSEEKFHSISATATDNGGLSTSTGPFGFVIDKTPPDVTIEVDGKPLKTGDQFNKAITPVIEAEDLTTPVYTITLNDAPYTRGTEIVEDGEYTLKVRVKDDLGNERVVDPIAFTVDKTPPLVRILEGDQVFNGGQFKRAVKPVVEINDLTDTLTNATITNRTTKEEAPWTSGQEISSDGHYTLKVTVTDELGWVTVAPPIDFTIDQAAPVIVVTENDVPLVTNTIFNRDARPKITVTDTTTPTIVATLNGEPYTSETLVTVERKHTLTVKATDELGFVTEIQPIEFVVDKTPPVVTLTENGVAFNDNALLNHDARPVVTVQDLTATTIVAKVDGQPYTLGTPVTTEGPHTFDVTVTDAAGWSTTNPTVRFVIDKTPPAVTVHVADNGPELVSGAEFNVTITPAIKVVDISATTISAKLDGAAYTPGTAIANEGEHVLEVSVTDAANWTTTLAPIAFIIDKTPPQVTVLESGLPFANDTKLNRPALTDVEIVDLTKTTTVATLNGAPFTFPGTVDKDGRYTLAVTVTDNLQQATTVAPIAFLVDQTPPVVRVTESGVPFDGGAFNRDVTPQITVEDLTSTTVAAQLNGAPYTFGTPITAEGKYTLTATITDELNWTTTISAIVFFIDKTPPVVTLMEGDNPLTDGLWFNRDVTPRAVIVDTTATTTTATLNGQPYTIETAIVPEGEYTLAVTVTDAVGLKTDVPPVKFTIDKTPPAITFTYPAANAVLATPNVIVVGDSDDAVSVTVNGVETTIDATEKKYATVSALDLQEGENVLTAFGVDRAGNHTTITETVSLDTRAPELVLTAPAANACIGANEIVVTGRAPDANLASVKVSAGGDPVAATISTDKRSFTATLPLPSEGRILIRAEAIDASGHNSIATVPVLVDRTKPIIEVTESGVAFNATLVNRVVALYVKAKDADTNATLDLKLDGQPYTSGTPISAEGIHELRAKATDCAKNTSEELVLRFTIDRTPPQIVSTNPANGAVLASKPAIAGVLSEPATLVAEGTPYAASVNGTNFSLSASLVEGVNGFVFLATDLAGNQSRTPYSITVDTVAPTVSIVEGGQAIPANAVYARDVVPVILSDDASATITATNNNAPFTSGTAITADGTYTITAKAKDTLGNESSTVTATFRIDRTGPSVQITSPAEGATINAASVEVRGTVASATSVSVNGVTATLSGGNFVANVPVDVGPNTLTAVAVDADGKNATDHVDVVRNPGTINILLVSPVDKTLTNRPTAVVAGQVLNVPNAQKVTINGVQIAIDPAGAFRRNDFPLTEGDNVITASVTAKSGGVSSVSVTVTADFTPPVLTVFGNGTQLSEGTRFATSPSLTLEATDNNPEGLTRKLMVDGELVSEGVTTLVDGGHALTATARDAAGNETRVDRTFFVGAAGAITGCALSNFEPANNAAVFSEIVRITGRSGGAAGVLINGKAASVADGSFCGDATLVAGRNEVTIRCADASGNPTSDPAVTLVLYRYVDPSITITSPSAGSVLTTNTVTVTGTVGAGVKSGDVNGIEFTVPDDGAPSHTFSVPNVALTPGLNVISARARTTSARAASASVSVKLLNNPPQIAITTPLAGSESGSQSVDVGGTYANIDPTTLTVSIGAATYPATTDPLSDTTGTWRVASVTLPPSAQSTITATGRNHAGTQTSATVQVRHVTTAPTVSITAPADNTYVPSSQSGAVRISGTVSTEGGTLVTVNGVTATVTEGSWTADVELSNASSGITPIIARATTPDGRNAADAIRIIKFAGALAVKESFPAHDANGVDPGATIVALFTNPLDASTANAFTVTDSRGAQVSGTRFVDKDAIAFAPSQPLESGERYTVTISTSLKDVAGGSLTSAHSFSFNVTTTAPITAPIVDDAVTTGCFSSATITGRVSQPGARVRLDVDGVTMTTVANDTAAFKFTFTFSGQTGYHLVRVREIGADGTLSAERALCYRISCAIPQVLNATLDRNAKTLAIQFSKAMDPQSLVASATGSIQIVPAGEAALAGTIAMNAAGDVATVALTSVPQKTIALTVKKTAKDTTGTPMSADYTQSFPYSDDPNLGLGDGYVNGAVYDATNGRPLESAVVEILGVTTKTTNARGRYTHPMREGAYTIQASAPGYTMVWRQVVVPAGAGVVPIDIRLTKRGDEKTANGSAQTLTHGADTKVTKKAELQLASASLATGKKVRLTSVGGQSLAGLLPLGWSPLAAAEIAIDDSSAVAPLPAAKLAFTIDASAVSTANQTLSLVQYDSERDEWRVVSAVATVAADGKVTFDITSSGNYALVYADKAPLAAPPAARAGIALGSAPNPCATTPDTCKLTGRSFTLDPKAVLPSGRTVATLITDGTKPYPSGTAVQAFIDEQLNLADGRVLYDPPFATDLLIYRTLAGDAGTADFHLSPSAQAVGVILRDGVDHIRVVDYPGRIDRGTLIGNEGGRVPGDDSVSLEIPAGAATEPLHATVTSISENDLASYGTFAGFRVAGGFAFSLTRANEPTVPDGTTAGHPGLIAPARATVSIPTSVLPSTTAQVVIAEVLPITPYGTMARVVALTSPVSSLDIPGVKVFSTRPIVSTELPLDGIVREGHYLVLAAEEPIAFAYGSVRMQNELAASNARITAGIGSPQTNALGVRDLTRVDGVFVVPVAAKPASPFSVVPRSLQTGDGAAYVATSAPDAGAFVHVGTLTLTSQPPKLTAITPPDGALLDATSPLVVQATFDVPLDAASVGDTIRVTNLTANRVMGGTVTLNGTSTVRFTTTETLSAGSRYSITILPTIRAANGAPYGRTTVTNFTTRAISTNITVNRDLIRITLPDDNGHAMISGRPGALPAGAMAVAVRRGRYFIESYTVVAGSDGSFSLKVGHLNAKDRVVLTDILDLQVLDPVSKAIIAILRLTPFVTPDGKSFLAPTDVDATFVSPEGIKVAVAAGTFDTPTMVSVAPAQKADFLKVPEFEQELNYVSSIELTFDGVAKKPLEVTVPIPEGTVTDGRTFLLGRLGQSVRGPRIEIDDTVFVDNGKFTTIEPRNNGARQVRTLTTYSGQKVKDYLLRIVWGGRYCFLDIRVPTGSGLGWGIIQGLQDQLDVFFDMYQSLYSSNYYITAKRGRIVAPLLEGVPFVVEGVDTATGMTEFSTSYDGIPPAPGDDLTVIPPPMPNPTGPYPVFARPFNVEQMELPIEDEDLTSIPGFNVRLEKTSKEVVVTRNGDEPKKFTVINVTKNAVAYEAGPATRRVKAAIGDRIVIASSADSVEPTREMQIVFNEGIEYGGDPTLLQNYFHLEKEIPATGSSTTTTWQPIDALLEFEIDSGDRRVTLKFPAELQRGATYRVVVESTLADTGSPVKTLAGGADLYLQFTVRKPKGDIFGTPITLEKGAVRDIALDGNIFYVSALEGGLYAYDASDPGAMLGKGPFAHTVPFPQSGDSPGAQWAVFVDSHGRVWTTAVNNMFGVIRSFRSEDFVAKAISGSSTPVEPKATSIISWRPGVNAGLPLGTTWMTQSDRAEATPRKLQVLSQDEKVEARAGEDFDDVFDGDNDLEATASLVSNSGEFGVYTFFVKGRPAPEYVHRMQRVTVENRTLGLRWSGDIKIYAGENSILIDNVLVRRGDVIRVMRNHAAYGVVSLFGFGIGVYDLNAIESNHLHAALPPSSYAQPAEQLALTEAKADPPCLDPKGPDGFPCLPPTLTYAADAAIVPLSTIDDKPVFNILAIDSPKGLMSVLVQPLPGSRESTGSDTPSQLHPNPFGPLGAQVEFGQGVTFTTRYVNQYGAGLIDHPRLATIRKKFADKGRKMTGRFSTIARFDTVGQCLNPATGEPEPCDKIYALISGYQFGLLVVDVGSNTVGADSLVDIIWVPSGCVAVRVIPGTKLATAIDGKGRTLLIDLARIDERDTVPALTPCPEGGCEQPIFKTVSESLAAGPDPLDTLTFGTDDPRILWKSEIPTGLGAAGSLAPVADPETGFFYRGDLTANTFRVLSGLDPRISVMVNLGSGNLENVTSIVPLGIQPPFGLDRHRNTLPDCDSSSPTSPDRMGPTRCKENVSLRVVRVVVALPGAMNESGPEPALAIDSERIPGARTEQTVAPMPRAHLRVVRPTATSSTSELRPVDASAFALRRVIPSTVPGANKLRYQKGFNRYVSKWIVAMADPRVKDAYDWTLVPGYTTKEEAGCFYCALPTFLKDKTADSDYFELYTNGRSIVIRPELNAIGTDDTVFQGSNYEYLGEEKRLYTRIGTVMADTVRPANILTAAQNPPVATGVFQGNVYLHSGELSTSAVDLDAGGRAGWNVVFDRSYRSRTLGGTAFGAGWDSGILKRLRPMPTGDVEYRDGSGEVWLFRRNGSNYDSPKGFFLKLLRTNDGWTLIDQKRRVLYFDDYGRIVREGDEFYTSDGKGNQIRYLYDENGRLDKIIDPNERANSVFFHESGVKDGLLDRIEDWRNSKRIVTYRHTDGLLTEVEQPKFTDSSGGSTTPKIEYVYDTGGGYQDQIELGTNLKEVKLPPSNGTGTTPVTRVTFTYGAGAPRDYVAKELWKTGEDAEYHYTAPSGTTPPTARTVDVLGQERKYTFKMPTLPPPAPGGQPTPKLYLYHYDRAHVDTMTESAVEVSTYAFGTTIDADTRPVSSSPRDFSYTYNEEGQTKTVTLGGVSTTGYSYESLGESLAGTVVKCTAVGPAGSNPCESGSTASPVSTTSALSDIVKFDFTFAGGFLQSVAANGDLVQTPEPHRGINVAGLQATNASMSTNTVFDLKTGLPTKLTTSGGSSTTSTANAEIEIKYPDTTPDDKWKRGLPTEIVSGNAPSPSSGAAQMKTKLDYTSEDTEVVTDPDGVVTTTTYDEWGRRRRITVSKPGQPLALEELWFYYPSGQLREHRRKQAGAGGTNAGYVTTQYVYDDMGRLTSTTVDNQKIGANPFGTKTETVDYSQYGTSERKVVTTSATGSKYVLELDSLGRTAMTLTTTDSSASVSNPNEKTHIRTLAAYDKGGNPAFSSDGVSSAVVQEFDAQGRSRKMMYPDGLVQETDYDGWGRATQVRMRRSAGSIFPFYTRTVTYTDDGRVQQVVEEGEAGDSRTTKQVWDSAGRSAGVSIQTSALGDAGRVVQRAFDSSGRLITKTVGSGSVDSVVASIEKSTFQNYGAGSRAPEISTAEAAGAPTFNTTQQFDTVGRPTVISTGAVKWGQSFDEAGNATKAAEPGRPDNDRTYDGSGRLATEKLGDGATQTHEYEVSGGPSKFIEPGPSPEDTTATTDLIGRPRVITYKDGTTQEMKYEGTRLAAVKDRMGRWSSYQYDENNGKLVAIRKGSTPGVGDLLDKLEYSDGTGRLTAWTNKDARIEYSNFDFDGNPRTTKQIRFKNGTGLDTTPVVLDEFTQQHTWNGYKERSSVTMPGNPAASWSKKLEFVYDAAGNIETLRRDGEVFLSGTYHNAARPKVRTVMVRPGGCTGPLCEKKLERNYFYEGGDGRLNEMSAKIDGVPVAGSRVKYEITALGSTMQIAESRLLGVSGDERATRYSYDARSRLFGSVTAVADDTAPPVPEEPGVAVDEDDVDLGVAQELLTPSGFRVAQKRKGLLTATERQALVDNNIDPNTIDPPGNSATETVGHRLETFSRGGQTNDYEYVGGARALDKNYAYAYDEKQRLIWIAERPKGPGVPLRRIKYDYDGNNRLVGRTAQTIDGPPASDPTGATIGDWPWVTETRANVLNADGLPAETTFVWDPISDRLVSVFRTGGSRIAGDPHNDLLKQIVHGDMGYDDPLEITSVDMTQVVPIGAPTPLARLYPIYDEAAGGTLQVVLNGEGKIVARSITTDPYGGEQFELRGASVDLVEITAKKDDAGNLTSVEVLMRATEQLDSASLPGGARLAVLNAAGQLVRTTTAAPQILDTDRYSVRWSLTAAQWTALTDPENAPTQLAVAATGSLRASLWAADIPIMPAPYWLTQIATNVSSSEFPVQVTKSLVELTADIDATPAGGETTSTPFAIDALALLGSIGTGNDTDLLLAATFQAQPFAEPMTRLAYSRARWYDAVTGTWLTPDPMGYIDSANLYSYAGGDPVNRRDPTGDCWNPFDEKCRQDMAWIAEDFVEGMYHPKNLKKNAQRALGGAVGVAKFGVKTVVGLAKGAAALGQAMVDSQPIVQAISPAAKKRHEKRVQAVQNFLKHPVDNTKNAVKNAVNSTIDNYKQQFDQILEHEQKGEYFSSGIIGGEIGAEVGSAVLGAGEAAVALTRLGGRLVSGSVLRSSTGAGKSLPSTGVGSFDELAVATKHYERWKANVTNRGFTVVEETLPRGTAAEIADDLVKIDPDQFRYIDLLHESRHIRQIERAGGRVANKATRNWFEKGAYEYEKGLGKKYGFTDDYMEFLQTRIDDYWNRSMRNKYTFSKSFREAMEAVWK